MGFEEVNKMEQRLEMVEAVITKRISVTDAAKLWDVSRETIYAWKRRYESEGEKGLEDRSSRPSTSPARMAWQMESRIVEMRRAHPRWGARRIHAELSRLKFDTVPARSSINAALVRNGLINNEPKQTQAPRRFERSAPGELLQIDGKELVLTTGVKVHIISVLDDHSRFCCAARVTSSLDCEAAIDVFDQVVMDFGLPYSVLADNGTCFSGRIKRTVNAFERHLWGFSVVTLNGRPYHPQTQGKIERYHRTLGEWLDDNGPFRSIRSLQREVDRFRHDYNELRPHQALDDNTPAERMKATAWKTADPTSNQQRRLRRSVRIVQSDGRLNYSEWIFGLGKAWAKQPLELIDFGHVIEINSSDGTLLYKFDPLTKPGRVSLGLKPGFTALRP